MKILYHIILYLLAHYSNLSELTSSKIIKMIYLADWHSAVLTDKTLTSTEWFLNDYGPTSDELLAAFKNYNEFTSKLAHDLTNKNKRLEFNDTLSKKINLSREQQAILDRVIDVTQKRNLNDFNVFVKSTYPVISSNINNKLNLIKKAQAYKDDNISCT